MFTKCHEFLTKYHMTIEKVSERSIMILDGTNGIGLKGYGDVIMKFEIGERIRQIRENRGLSREKFCERIGISPKFLYEIEYGKKSFSVEILCRISSEYDVSSEWILFGECKDNNEMNQMKYYLELVYGMKS